MDTGIFPSVTFFYFKELSQILLVFRPAGIVTNLLDFKTFQASGASKDHDVWTAGHLCVGFGVVQLIFRIKGSAGYFMDFNNALDCVQYVYIAVLSKPVFAKALVSLLGFNQVFKHVAQQEGFLSEMWLYKCH